MPRRRPDSYHTCYTLAGLSSVQYSHYYSASAAMPRQFAPAFAWACREIISTNEDDPDRNVFDEDDRLQPLHPVYVIPHQAASNMQAWAEEQGWKEVST